MKFYYPEYDRETNIIKTLNGKVFDVEKGADVRESLMYLRIDHGDYVRFIDHFGNIVGKDFPSATVHSGGFARLGKKDGKERFLDIFMRESEEGTDSGFAAFDLYKFLYGEVISYDDLYNELEKMNDEYFVDKVFYDGIIKMIVKYLRDLVQTEYDNGLELTCEQTLRECLGKCKTVCDNKRARALEAIEEEKAKNNRRNNCYKASVSFLDNYNVEVEADDERRMVCINEEDANEYDI